MSVKVECPQCREKYNAGNEYIGRRFRCKCNAVIAVPDLDEILAAPDTSGNAPKQGPSTENSPPFRENARFTLYAFLALTCGTTGALAVLGFFIISVCACTSPIFNSSQENACVAAVSFAIALLSFLCAAVFRTADLALRRSPTRYFF